MNELVLNSLGSVFLGACYFAYKIFRNRCKSKCTESGLDIHIGILSEQISQKLDENKETILNDLMDKLTDKIQIKRSPNLSAAVAPEIEQSIKIDI